MDKENVTIFYTFMYHQGASKFAMSLLSFYLKELINLQSSVKRFFQSERLRREFWTGTPGVEWGADGCQPHKGGKNEARQAPLSTGFSRQEY